MSYTEEDVNAVLCLYFAYAKVCWTERDIQTKEVITNVLSYAKLHDTETLTRTIPEEKDIYALLDGSMAYDLVCRVNRYLLDKVPKECERMKLPMQTQLHCLRELQNATDWVMPVFQLLSNERKYLSKSTISSATMQQFSSYLARILDSTVI